MSKIKVAILGSGNIGTDLLIKLLRSKKLECNLFIGRNPESKGIAKAKELGIKIACNGIEAILKDPNCCDLVFDATSSKDHLVHWPLLKKSGKTVIDMTPSQIGKQIIPAINLKELGSHQNVNMVSCGGQASIPLIYAISRACSKVSYIEVVSSIASNSAGPATRINLDEYIENTEGALRAFTGCEHVKTILILNPAFPCIDMQTTLSFKTKDPDMNVIKQIVQDAEYHIRQYVPGYKVTLPPVFENDRIIMSIQVKGLGDYLPSYAGNLDIINCAAIATAEAFAC